MTTFWFFVALISLTLSVMNLLPIPGLDGGRWMTMTIFRLARQKLTKEREEKIQTVGVTILLGIMILVVISDVFKII
jgi:regulator of sigma E protease